MKSIKSLVDSIFVVINLIFFAVTKEEEIKRSVQQSEKSIPIALLAIFMTMGLIGLLVAAIKCGSKRIANELDNVSIASSETSCGSCVTAIDGEAISENTLSRKNSRTLEV